MINPADNEGKVALGGLTATGFRGLLRRIVPFSLRVAVARGRSMGVWRREAEQFRFPKSEASESLWLVAEHRSPLRRAGTTYAEELQRGKETNVGLAAQLVDGLTIPSGAVFSYHHAVGMPSRRRGFVKGAELQDGSLKPGIGGGCCQVSNLLYVLALLSGAEIVERHRHGFDLFPDSGRTVPFGCGATVFFPMRDLRFRNMLDQPIRLGMTIEDGHLVGRVQTVTPLAKRFEIFEMETEMRREGEVWIRENRVGRRAWDAERLVSTEEVAHNVAKCLYEPTTGVEAAQCER
ncbi:VanW family protein [Fimbriimonas ginsengisoli]|uniref:Vancomycin B-type resistance protein vanW n=1 Tax=Fimbriimonas ginsengisoli Gsoil 348 TaxID=661478 RepID=A0A068NY88_FIMGI|nr:VanW family protein [Fimbriimonas ginsengisoli]AIE86749.1 Vancomycin B-type resistance protein vanW [Fimbriimonas ginsengisoli Gsoil 348]